MQYFRDDFERKHAAYIHIRGGTSSIGGRPRAVNPAGEIITGMQRLAHGAHFTMQQEASDLSMGTLVHQMEHFSWSVFQSLSTEYLRLPDGQERMQLWGEVPSCIRAHFPADVVIYGAIDGLCKFLLNIVQDTQICMARITTDAREKITVINSTSSLRLI